VLDSATKAALVRWWDTVLDKRAAAALAVADSDEEGPHGSDMQRYRLPLAQHLMGALGHGSNASR
jgi:hypothetical protein